MTLNERVLLILASGRWARLNELATTLRVSRREIEAAVEELRLDGQPIIAGLRGVCLTRDPDHLEAYLRQRRERARAILRAHRPLRSTARQMRERTDLVLGL
jgi:biotin operon repressor